MHRSLIPVLGVPVIMPFQGDVSGQRVEDERQSAAQNRQRQRAALLRLQQSCAEVAEEVERKKRSLMDALREQKTLKGRMREVEIQQMGVRPGETEPYDSFTEAAISEIMSDDASGSVAAGLEDDDDATRGLLTEEHEEWCEDAKFFTVPNICPFVKKCYEIVNSKRTDAIVSWSADGLNFVVHDPQRCADEVLPKYFKHANLMSWIRQLNKYGFRRVVRERPSDVNSQHGSASRGAGAGSSSRDGGDVALPAVGHPVGLVVSRPPEATTLHFQHPCFQRGNLTSLPSIRVQKTSDGGMSEATMSQMAAMGADTHRGRAKSTPVSSREGSEGMPAKSATRKRKISGSGHMDLSEHTAAGGFQNLVGMGNGMGYPAVGLPHAQQHYPAQVTHAVHMQQAQQVPGGHIFGGMQPGWGMQPPPPGSMHWGQSQGPPQQQQQQLGHGQQMPQQGQGQQQQQGQREGPQLQQAPLQQGQPQPQPQGQPKAVHDAQRRVSFGGAQTDQWGAPLAPSTAVHPSVALHPAVMAAAATQEQQRTSPFPPNPGDARPGSAGFRAAQRSPPGRFGQSGPTVDPRGAGFGGGAQAGFRGVAQSWAQGQAGPLQMPPPPQQQQQQQWQQQTPLRQRRISFYTDFLLFPARTAAVTVGSDTPGAPPTPVAQDPFRATVRPYAETPGSSSADSTPVRPKHRRLRRTVVMSQSPASAQPLAPVQQARQRGAGGGAHRRPPQPSAGGNARGFIEDEADVSGDEHGGEDESEEETTGEDENISQLINNNATPDDGGARWRYLRGQLEVDPSPACQLPTPVRVARYRAELRYNVNDTPPDYDFEQDGRRVRRRGLAEAEDSQSCSLDSFICDDDEPVIYSGTSPVS
mmetsp:Transcript_38751/g.96039  ORF Transcript_38751/g.96039 Transcript_38751/m.96039 type:complete len:867 (+) Transcript_38751:62-2662(+)